MEHGTLYADETRDNNMKLTKIFFAICIICVAFACGGKKGDGIQTFAIEGTLTNAADKMLYIEEMTPDNGPQFLDSILCDAKGHFKYEGMMHYQTFFNLHSNQYDYIVLLPADGDKIELSGDANNLGSTYMVKGAPESQLMWQIQSYINQSNLTIQDLAQQDNRNKSSLSEADYKKAHAVTDSLFLAERETTYRMLLNFIDDNPGSLSTLYAVDAPFNHNMRVFYQETDFDIFEQVLQGLEESCPDNPHTQYYRTRVERARAMASTQEIVIGD